MKSIFDIENRLDIQNEFNKFLKVFHKLGVISENYISEYITLFRYFDLKVFKKWKYRGTMLSTKEFLTHIGVSEQILKGKIKIDEETFLRYIEFVLNMIKEAHYEFLNSYRDPILDATIENIDIILEKMNYKSEELEDKIIISKRNADVDSILVVVPVEISHILLEYNDFRIKDNLEEKKKILKTIDLYIEEHKEIKQQIEKTLDDSIGTIVNKMGINHPLKEKPYKSFTEKQLIEWYDKCFILMLHAIRTVEINKIKNERKELVNN